LASLVCGEKFCHAWRTVGVLLDAYNGTDLQSAEDILSLASAYQAWRKFPNPTSGRKSDAVQERVALTCDG
jgi:hypothetical protein